MQNKPSWSEVHGAQLVQLANDRSQQGRALLTTAVVELFNEDSHFFTASDQRVMTKIILQLVETIEGSVKTAIAERLAAQSNIPRELALSLANMESNVAFPILKTSTVLQDPDLISIVMHKTMEHQMAVSMRSIIPVGVSRALATSEHDEVVISLLGNDGASIDEGTFDTISNRPSPDNRFKEAMVSRRDLPPAIAKGLYWAVSAALRKELIEQHGIDEDSVDDAIESTVPNIISNLNNSNKDANLDAQVKQAIEKDVLGKILLRLLQNAEIPRFTAWLASASHLRNELVSKIMFEQGGECLAAIFTVLKISREEYLSIFIMLRQGRLGEHDMPEGEVRAAGEFYANVQPEKALTLVRRLQRNPEYLNAQRQVDASRRS
jgi:uncharacterized protein (DUF2336 family)